VWNFTGFNYGNIISTFRTNVETYFPYELVTILHRPYITDFDGSLAADANPAPEKGKHISCSYYHVLVTRHGVCLVIGFIEHV
jgi:hypothetical protein